MKFATVAPALLAVMLAGCGSATQPLASTVTVTAPATVTITVTEGQTSVPPTAAEPSVPPTAAEPSVPVAFAYGPRGAYAVGEARGGLTQVIPPGRYRIEGVEGQGYLKQCDSVLCDMTTSSDDGVIDTTLTESGMPTIVEIAPSVVSIFLFDATLTPLE